MVVPFGLASAGEKDAVVTRQDESGGRLKHDLWGPVVVDRKSPMYLGAERGTNNTGELCAVRGRIVRATRSLSLLASCVTQG